MHLPRDIQDFLHGYPKNEQDTALTANLKFYSNTLRCQPDSLLIDEIHEQWFGDYSKLERKHGFIQWLFPIQEHGMNFESQPLQRYEIHVMKANVAIVERVLKSYILMLDFYGMRLVSSDTGLIDRTLPPRNFTSRYKNLVRSPHNNLRITRILKSLSEFGLEHLNVGFLLHVLNEQSESDELNSSAIRSSMDKWWANCLRDGENRAWISGTIKRVRRADGYVFTRSKYEGALRRLATTGTLKEVDPPAKSS